MLSSQAVQGHHNMTDCSFNMSTKGLSETFPHCLVQNYTCSNSWPDLLYVQVTINMEVEVRQRWGVLEQDI